MARLAVGPFFGRGSLMSRFTPENEEVAREIISRYPHPKSALILLLHLAQEQDGYVSEDTMEHIAELIGVTPAEVLGTCSFYEMFKREQVGTYPSSTLRARSSSALGLWSQTATAVSSPNQVTPNTSQRESGSGTNRS